MKPTQIGRQSDEVKEMVERFSEVADTYRVYEQQWIHQMTSTDAREQLWFADDLHVFFMAKFEGRVKPEDSRQRFEGRRMLLELNLWNLVMETKELSRAEEFATHDMVIVERATRAETKLLDYGKKKLRGVREQLGEATAEPV